MVIVTVPGAMGVTRPRCMALLTAAMLVSLDTHVACCVTSTDVPSEKMAAAVSWVSTPTPDDGLPGLITTLVTFALVTVHTWPWLRQQPLVHVAAIVATPAAIAFACPLLIIAVLTATTPG
ncbi:MAG: hypothetical protein V9F82_00105 [Dermatophilaceae bacterium]